MAASCKHGNEPPVCNFRGNSYPIQELLASQQKLRSVGSGTALYWH